MGKRKIRQQKSRKITKNIKLNTRSSYNFMHEHNYFRDIYKKKCQLPDENECSDHTEIIANDNDKYNPIPDWCIANSSSDEADDTKDMPLSHILKIELERDLLHEVRFC